MPLRGLKNALLGDLANEVRNSDATSDTIERAGAAITGVFGRLMASAEAAQVEAANPTWKCEYCAMSNTGTGLACTGCGAGK
ncbi:MAG: hypothetical protein FWD83_10490 [Promicromonosporaceae bacterium]|nr:hypothetical protein [Promicromonosporaceae bacterium]